MAEFPAMPFWTDAYLADTTHFTTIEHGAYFLLLLAAWRSKSHMLPNDDVLLARYCHLTATQWTKIKRKIVQPPFFQIDSGFLVQPRLLDEINSVRRRIAQRSDAGKASALKRLNRDATSVQRGGNGAATTTTTYIKREKFESGKEERKGFQAFPGSLEFQTWKSHAVKLGPAALARELIKREQEGRAFNFETRWPPGHKETAA